MLLLSRGLGSSTCSAGGVEGGGEALRAGGAGGARWRCSPPRCPFVVEGHFGILGTSFNPDMSQHLLAADRLAAGDRLAAADARATRSGRTRSSSPSTRASAIGLVQGFGGLTLAVAVLACLTALGAFGAARAAAAALVGALLVGLPYMVASYFAQGAFKETIQALFVLAFASGCCELRDPSRGLARRLAAALSCRWP